MKKFFHIFLSILITSQLLVSVLSNRAIAAGSNLITNQSVEQLSADGVTPSGWASSSWGSNTPSFSYKPVGQTGTKSLYLKLSNYVDGDAKWYFSPVAVTPNTKYVFSDYYKSDVTSEVVVELTSTSGNVSYQWLGTMSPSAAWKKAGFYMTTKSDTAKVTVLHLLSSNGYLQTDNFTLATATQVTTSQGIMNNSFEQSDDIATTQPLGWQTGKWGNNTAVFTRPTTGGYASNNFGKVTVTNYVDGDAKWVFDPIAVTPGTKYYLGDYYKSGVSTDMVAEITNTDGSTSYQWLGTLPASASWKRAGYHMIAPAGAAKVSLLHIIYSNGTLSTDNYSATVAASAVVTNGVPNNSLEQVSEVSTSQPLAWQTGKWGTNSTSFSYLSSGYNSAHSVKTQITSYTDGDAKWYFEPVAVTPNTTYQVSDWYQSNIDSRVIVQILNQDNSISYVYLKNAPASTAWTNYSDFFTVPATAKSATVLHLIAGVGFLITDSYSMQQSAVTGFARPIVTVTFDDGWKSIYQNGLPILTARNIKSTQYIITGKIGTDPQYMTLAELQAFKNAGHELGSHTVSHPDLTTLSPLQLQDELANSKSWLQTNMGVTAENLATPYGSYNGAVLTAIRGIYASHRGVEMGYNSKTGFDIYNLKVQDVVSTTTQAELQSWIAQAKATNTWLILVYHSVDTTGGQYSVTPTQLDAQMLYLQSSGVTVETLAQALAEVKPQL